MGKQQNTSVKNATVNSNAGWMKGAKMETNELKPEIWWRLEITPNHLFTLDSLAGKESGHEILVLDLAALNKRIQKLEDDGNLSLASVYRSLLPPNLPDEGKVESSA